MLRPLLAVLCLLFLAAPVLAAGRPITVDDLLAVKSVSDPQIAPDGESVVYVVSEIDRDAGKSNSSLWLVPLEGGEPRRLTTAPGTNNHPRWSPDGERIAFVSDRGGSSQVWILPIDGGEARQLTKLPIDVSGPIWSPTGDRIAFTAEVDPGKTPEETAAKDKEKADSKSQARVFDRLMIRHWTAWDEGKRSHLFVCDAETGEAKDLTPALEVNTPPKPFGGSSDYAFSADGREIAFTAEPTEDPAWSTNTDIWVVPVEGGEARNITAENQGADAQPAYSPDGKFLAYVSQARAGFEADQWVLKVAFLPNGSATPKRDVSTPPEEWKFSPVSLSDAWDRPVGSFTWGAGRDNGYQIYATIDDRGSVAIVPAVVATIHDGLWVTLMGTDDPGRLVRGGVNNSVQVASDGKSLVFIRHNAAHPAEVFKAGADGSDPIQLTHHNDPLLADLDLAPAEGFRFEGADGDEVSGWLVRPPGFDPEKKYPVLFLIHGGPQGAWHDEWHARWNYQLFAAPGYALVAINPRGSTGYGQEFTDQISRDWAGRVFDDLMAGLDHALKTYPFLDADRVGAAGGSYGGYMVNWLAGHTDRFKCLVSHAGIFDLTSMNVTTEELWFPEWEFGGSPWETPELHLRLSPSGAVENFKTPTLVIHGALDFRVPDAQGLAMFTALQRMGVPSRYVFFPDEGHWILKPANRVVWWREVHDWLARYLKDQDESR